MENFIFCAVNMISTILDVHGIEYIYTLKTLQLQLPFCKSIKGKKHPLILIDT